MLTTKPKTLNTREKQEQQIINRFYTEIDFISCELNKFIVNLCSCRNYNSAGIRLQLFLHRKQQQQEQQKCIKHKERK